jgi:enoyl-CoA hydratase/carnithine racemase
MGTADFADAADLNCGTFGTRKSWPLAHLQSAHWFCLFICANLRHLRFQSSCVCHPFARAVVSHADIAVTAASASVAFVTLNRPKQVNAVKLSMWRDLKPILHDLQRREDVRVIVLTGAGGNFSAGADIKEFAQNRMDPEQGMVYEHHYVGAVEAVRSCAKPTIAAVTGNCMGGACALAMACDFRFADATARFAIPAAKLGVVYGLPECTLLVALVGVANAKRILYTGDPVGADEAFRMGLVDERVAGPVTDAALAFAAKLAANAPLSLAGSKRILNALARGDAWAHQDEFHGLMEGAVVSEDYREGALAFVEKRRPKFKGR